MHAFLSARVEGVELSVERQAGVGGGGWEPDSQSPSKMLITCQTLKETSVETSTDSPGRILQAPNVPFLGEVWVGLFFRRFVLLLCASRTSGSVY